MSIHIGHRQRLKERFRAEGLDHFGERHVLELLLFYAIPQRDTAPLAQELLDHFGSLSQVLDASAAELEKNQCVYLTDADHPDRSLLPGAADLQYHDPEYHGAMRSVFDAAFSRPTE